MLRKNRARASSLFLMELIIAILFFSVASAVCVQFFVKSHLLSSDSDALNHAVNECTGAAEVIDAADSMEDSVDILKKLYPNGSYPEQSLQNGKMEEIDISVCYDENFEECGRQDAAYFLEIHMDTEDQMIHSKLQFLKLVSPDKTDKIYELSTKHHIARRTDYEER